MSSKEKTPPQSFKELKNEMKSIWSNEVVDANDLLQASQIFFKNNLLDYSINCLFIELLDFQIHIKDEFNKLFNEKGSNDKDFPLPLFPIYDEKYIYRDGHLKESTFKSNILTIFQHSLQPKIITFLDSNPLFNYYFWDVTFPHMFSDFLCFENCESAVNFLVKVEKLSNKHFLKGASSFIRHNYLFQNSFMQLFFIYNKEDGDLIDKIKKALINSIDKLTMPQLQILKKFGETDERKKYFIEDIIIRSLKLWKYSSLYLPAKITYNNDGNDDLINVVNDIFFGETPQISIDDFLNPILEKAEDKKTVNNISFRSFMGINTYLHPITFLDLLIIESIVDNKDTAKSFKINYLLRKAFTFSFAEDYSKKPSPNDKIPAIAEPEVDQKIKQEWNKFAQNCVTQNKNPLDDVYNPNKCNMIDENFYTVGLVLARYKHNFSEQMTNYLEDKSKMLIPLKSNIESVRKFLQLYSDYFASTFQFKAESYVNETKNLYIDFFTKKTISILQSNLKKNQKYVKDEFKKSTNAIKKIIRDRLIDKFAIFFNTDKKVYKLVNEFNIIITEINKSLPNLYSNIQLDDNDIHTFELSLAFLDQLANSQLTVVCDQIKPQSDLSESPIQIIDFDGFEIFRFSGIFDYIKDTLVALSISKETQLGQFLIFVSEIKKLLSQFLIKQNISFLEKRLNLNGEKDIVKAIFIYSLASVESPLDTGKSPQEEADLLIALLIAGYVQVKDLVEIIPSLSDLFENIKFLMYCLDVPIKNEESGSLILELEKSAAKNNADDDDDGSNRGAGADGKKRDDDDDDDDKLNSNENEK